MIAERSQIEQLIEWGVAGRPLEGDVSGDGHVVVPSPRGVTLAVIDGLGHGIEAAVATRVAIQVVRDQPGSTAIDLIERCHEELQKTRGVVMTLALLDAKAGRLDWCGVGNVEATLLRAGESKQPRESIALRGGVVGYRLPPLKVNTLQLSTGDVLVMATDGLRQDFAHALDPSDDVQASAERVLSHAGKGNDDALVLVARYLGGGS